MNCAKLRMSASASNQGDGSPSAPFAPGIARLVVELIQPIAMDEGLRFAIREGGRTVGAGVVTKVVK